MENLVCTCICSVFYLSSSPGASCSLRYDNTAIRPANKSTRTSQHSNERKNHMFLTLGQKLEMIKLSQKTLSKVKIDQNLGQTDSQAGSAKEKPTNEILKSTPVNTQMKRKGNSLINHMEKV